MLDNDILLKTRKTLSVLLKQTCVMLRDINITAKYLAYYNYRARCYYMYDWTTQRIGISFVIKTYALHHVSYEIYYELNLLNNTLAARSCVTNTAKPDAIACLAYNWRITLEPHIILNSYEQSNLIDMLQYLAGEDEDMAYEKSLEYQIEKMCKYLTKNYIKKTRIINTCLLLCFNLLANTGLINAKTQRYLRF